MNDAKPYKICTHRVPRWSTAKPKCVHCGHSLLVHVNCFSTKDGSHTASVCGICVCMNTRVHASLNDGTSQAEICPDCKGHKHRATIRCPDCTVVKSTKEFIKERKDWGSAS